MHNSQIQPLHALCTDELLGCAEVIQNELKQIMAGMYGNIIILQAWILKLLFLRPDSEI